MPPKKNKNKNHENNNTTQHHQHIAGRPYYDNDYQTGLCPRCNLIWKLQEQIMYTTVNGTRTYGICPECRDKRPLRKKPRTRDGFLARFPPKRID